MEVPELHGCFTCGVAVQLASAGAEWTGIQHWSYLTDLWDNDTEIETWLRNRAGDILQPGKNSDGSDF